jgi:hypothetical protein
MCIYIIIYIYIPHIHMWREIDRERDAAILSQCGIRWIYEDGSFDPWNPLDEPQSTGIYDDLWRFMDVHALKSLKHGMIDRFPPIITHPILEML